MIRTPDQRLRVFVSSTLAELGPERKAVKSAIERLALIPVLFESGARPHAPQEVYRAYLEQSDIFIGIYAASYGWVAPDMDISGLEDEFRLCGSRPRLIYVKTIAGERDPRLAAMLAAMKASERISYQKFTTPEELASLVLNDLAVLLSERFDAQAEAPMAAIPLKPLPALRGPSIGREADLQAIAELVLQEGAGLVTITGPGGTGKTRMSLMVAHRVAAHFPDGAVFVPLASIKEAALVAEAIASALGSFDNARRSATDLLNDVLREKRFLLVLDNFEQVLPAATLLTDLLEHCPKLRIVVSSRTPLHVRGEQVYPLAPLQEPLDPWHGSVDGLLTIPSVDLFVQRAREASAGIVLDEANVRAIAAICKKLDGIPLAIELAAAHTRMLPPVALQQRMENALALLTRGARDLPERQRTMRGTIAWSHDLLEDGARALFRRLAVMADRFTPADAHAVGGSADEVATLAALEQLVDQGLVRAFPPATWSGGDRLFALLQVVREFALEILEGSGERGSTEHAHALHFGALAGALERKLLLEDNGSWIEQMDAMQADLRAAFWHFMASGERARAWRLIADLRGYWAHAGKVSEAFAWMEAAGVHPEHDVPELSDLEKGRTRTAAGLALAVSGAFPPASALLEQAVTLIGGTGNGPELSRALSYLGLSQLSQGLPQAKDTLLRAVQEANAAGVDFDACMSLSFLCEACIAAGDIERAEEILDRARPIAARHKAGSGEAMYLLQRGNLLLVQGNSADALESYEASVRVFDATRMIPLSGWSWWGIGYASFQLGRRERSLQGFNACLDRARRTSDNALACAAMLCFALLAHDRGDLVTAARLLGSAEGLAADIGYTFWSTDRVLHEDVKARLSASLEADRKDRELETGRRMRTDEAIALSIQVAETCAGAQ